jgi:hypothetical protein
MKPLTIPMILAAGMSLPLAATMPSRAAIMVDIELAHILDGSDSNPSFEVQRDAYVQIFSDPNFFDNIVQPLADFGLEGKIAVAIFQFGFWDTGDPVDSLGNPAIDTAVDWTLIESQNDAEDFANKVANLKRIGNTNNCGPSDPIGDPVLCPGGERSLLGAGIDQAVFGELVTDLPTPIDVPMDGIVNNDFESLHGVLDLSSDGLWNPTNGQYPELDIDPLRAIEEAVLQPDVSVLNIITYPTPPNANPDEDELNSYLDIFADGGKTNLNGDPGFLILEPAASDYVDELYGKILRETAVPTSTSTPEPSFLLGLLGLGLFSVGRAIRRN